MLIGLVLTGAGVMQSFGDAASASSPPGVGQQVANDTGGYSEYSICAGVPSGSPCSTRGKAGGTEVQGAIAVDGNFAGIDFYIGNMLANTQTLAVAGNVGGTLAILGAGNSGVYGGSNSAHLPSGYCSSGPCLIPNLQSPSAGNALPAFGTINGALTTESAALGALPTTTGDTVVWNPAPAHRSLVLTGTNTQENVFDLAATGSGVLAGTSDLYINVPPGSSTVINVPESSVNCSSTACLQIVYYWDGSVYEAGNATPTATVQALMANTVVNFPNATSVTLSSAGPSLNILAPKADFTFFNGNIFGFIYANRVNGSFEDEVPPMGTVPSTTTTSTTTSTTTPTSTTTSTTTPTSTTTSTTTSTSSSTTSTTLTSTASTTSTTVVVPNTPGTVGTTTSTTLPTTTTTLATTTTPTTAATTSTTNVAVSTSTTVATHAHFATTTAPAATTTTAAAATTTTAPAATTTTAAAATTTTAPAATTTTAPATTSTTVRTHAHHTTATTAPASTTTVPAASTTTAPAVTTTVAAATTTTAPASTTTAPASTTTVPASTTTAPASTTTAPASTTTVPAATTTTTTTPKTLAFTGSDSSTMMGWGVGLILLGGGVVAFSYRRRALP